MSDGTHSMRGNGGLSSARLGAVLDRASVSAATRPRDRVRRAHEQRLDARHHHRVVGVRLVELEHRELRIVRPVDALVPEVVADLVHPIEPADDQPLEIQLVGDAQIERHVERVVMRRERPRRRAAIQRLQHRRLDLEIVRARRATRRISVDHPRARAKQRAHFGMHGEIGVALAIPLLGIGESRMPHGHAVDDFFLAERQRPQRLREQLDLGRRAPSLRRCACGTAGPITPTTSPMSNRSSDADTLVAQHVLLEVQLNATAVVGEVRERRLAVRAPRDDPAGDAHRLAFLLPVRRMQRDRLGRAMRAVERVRERRDAARDERVELLAPRALDEVQLVGSRRALPRSARRAPSRYASMNGSMSPSITFCTSGIFSSVRWSLTIVYGWKT